MKKFNLKTNEITDPKNRVSRCPVLFGNSFPLPLIRREVNIRPARLDVLREILKTRAFVSFWGHNNTLKMAEAVLGLDIAPGLDRPTIALDENNFPVLNGKTFGECWVLSPDYQQGFRPAIGVEVPAESITGWQVLRLVWKK